MVIKDLTVSWWSSRTSQSAGGHQGPHSQLMVIKDCRPSQLVVIKVSLAGAATSIISVATSTCLSRQKYACPDRRFCRDKHNCVVTKYFCRNKAFVAINICRDKRRYLWQFPPMISRTSGQVRWWSSRTYTVRPGLTYCSQQAPETVIFGPFVCCCCCCLTLARAYMYAPCVSVAVNTQGFVWKFSMRYIYIHFHSFFPSFITLCGCLGSKHQLTNFAVWVVRSDLVLHCPLRGNSGGGVTWCS